MDVYDGSDENLRHLTLLGKSAWALLVTFAHMPCADPDNFVRGDPILTCFFFWGGGWGVGWGCSFFI